ncbi:MAG: hypothetical protein J6Z31_04530 [Fibrobacter sp.]|nr:hypothetical protein [Fibrobacter sp.]
MKKLLCILALLLSASAFAQNMPIVVGGVAETGYGILNDGTDGAGLNRMTPFIGAWINGIGYCRLGYGLYDYSRTDSEGDHVSVESRAFSATLGASLGGSGKPYLVGSFTRAKQLSNVGDVTWYEWGVGGGATFQLISTAAIVTELEYRWIRSHYDPVKELRVSGTRLQFNVGFVVYVY